MKVFQHSSPCTKLAWFVMSSGEVSQGRMPDTSSVKPTACGVTGGQSHLLGAP